MHYKDDQGNHWFKRKTSSRRIKFCFFKDNYESHSGKHWITGETALSEIAKTLESPDIISTKGLVEVYYRVTRVIIQNGSKVVMFWKVVCIIKRQKKLGSKYKMFEHIKTALPSHALIDMVINQNEEILWRRPGSQI